jgi:hypothetical protein
MALNTELVEVLKQMKNDQLKLQETMNATLEKLNAMQLAMASKSKPRSSGTQAGLGKDGKVITNPGNTAGNWLTKKVVEQNNYLNEVFGKTLSSFENSFADALKPLNGNEKLKKFAKLIWARLEAINKEKPSSTLDAEGKKSFDHNKAIAMTFRERILADYNSEKQAYIQKTNEMSSKTNGIESAPQVEPTTNGSAATPLGDLKSLMLASAK